VNTPTIPFPQKRRLQAHFGFTGMPFRKNMHAHQMFDSRAQRDLVHGLALWAELHGLALVTGESGVGKSISTRRFVSELDEQRFRIVRFSQMPTTPTGFLRSLSRVLGLPMRRFGADLFDQVRDHLRVEAGGPHVMIVLDDAEGMRPDALDLLRRLLCADLDADDRFSVLLAGTDALLHVLGQPDLAPLRSRIAFAAQLRPFSLEDTQNYVGYQLQQAGGKAGLLSDDAVRAVFQASHGIPRRINQLVLHALIHAVVEGRDDIDGRYMNAQISSHPLYARVDA
jgi:type II secretory pathway predicted ATPase ExeA